LEKTAPRGTTTVNGRTMRKIVATLLVSLDGVVEAPQCWHFAYMDEEMATSVGQPLAASDALLLGRITYEELAEHWFAAYVDSTPKVVVSTSLEAVDRPNESLLDGDLTEAIAELKQEPGRTIGVAGSPTLVESLIRRGLVDELRLLVHPVVVGRGRRLFEHVTGQRPLDLMSSQRFAAGVLDLTYRPG
jgi:dihydrofolate reductase